MRRATAFLAAGLLAATASIAAHSQGSAAAVNDAAVTDGLPRTLDEFGFFADAPAQEPAARVTPYRLNTPLYSDGAEKLRFVYLPEGVTMQAAGEGLLDIPVGAALIKTFAFGEGDGRRLIETRVLLHRADGWLALPYLWNEEQTEARLAVAGARVEVTTPRGQAISYRVPNKNQCKECHGLEGAVVPIGPKARNLAHEWLGAMVDGGLLDRVPEGADVLPLWEARGEAGAEDAARAYLDVNCAHCHQPSATASNSGLDLRWEQHDPRLLGIMKRPVAAGRGSGGLLFDVVPGKPGESILVHRMDSDEPGVAMPELGKATVDPEGVEAVERWIAGIAP
ncbi:SO2930 family diheme c-type cytochrome [Pelagerythrobacter sp.]|uniref:SO2930 family diheme c-type cytochrome n=1 Tax=Pelagerythrobacter sp. TaxID=2800702 RepID=UPI0035AFE459